jgi:hypothetical protein
MNTGEMPRNDIWDKLEVGASVTAQRNRALYKSDEHRRIVV